MSEGKVEMDGMQVVPVDELRVGDRLPVDNSSLIIDAIVEKPKTRVLYLEHSRQGWERTYRARRTTELYVRPRKCYEVRAMRDNYGPCIYDDGFVDTIEAGREWATEKFAHDPQTEWVEIVEGEFPGKGGPEFDYLPDGQVIRVDPPSES